MDQGVLIRQLQAALAGLGFRAGHVTSTGSADLGSGFSCTRNGVGDYTLTFDPPFQTTARVVAMQGQGPGAVATMKQSNATAASNSSFRLVAVNTAAALVDADFWFFACG